MKKLFYLLSAALLLAGASSCNKSNQAATVAPTISWAISGDTVEIGSKEDATVTVTVPEGVAECTIEVKLPSIEINTILNSTYISIRENAAGVNTSGKTVEPVNGVLDLVNDSKSASALSLGSVKDAKSLSLNLVKVVNTIMSGYYAKDGDVFVFNIMVKDAVGKEARKSVSFHWTEGPIVTWLSGNTVISQKETCAISLTALSDTPATFKVTAPAVIETFTITVCSNNTKILQPVSIYGESDTSIPGGILLDLVGSLKAQGLDYGAEIGDKIKVSEVTLNLFNIIKSMAVLGSAGDTIQFTFNIVDALDKSTSAEINYVITD